MKTGFEGGWPRPLRSVLASFFFVGGMFRAIGSAAQQFPRWGWAALSGVISAALGIVLLLGFAIGVDLMFDGVGLAAAGLALQRLPTT